MHFFFSCNNLFSNNAKDLNFNNDNSSNIGGIFGDVGGSKFGDIKSRQSINTEGKQSDNTDSSKPTIVKVMGGANLLKVKRCISARYKQNLALARKNLGCFK